MTVLSESGLFLDFHGYFFMFCFFFMNCGMCRIVLMARNLMPLREVHFFPEDKKLYVRVISGLKQQSGL